MRKIIIDPRVIRHLGRDLITSSEVAIIELVKNSIDAHAKEINLRLYNNDISNLGLPENPLMDEIMSRYRNEPILLVEDNGCGMSDAVIDNGFLKIATNIKAAQDNTLGEKGIGRLATQRLGSALLVETASADENHTSFVFIDWEKVISGQQEIPSFEAAISSPHTRLWIFGAHLEDYIDNAFQFQQLSFDTDLTTVIVNRELKSALNFLISPFANVDNDAAPKISFYFNDQNVDIAFPQEMLQLSESIHSFKFGTDDQKLLTYKLSIKPWFAERVHRALVKADAFKRLKMPHKFYQELLEKNDVRLRNVLEKSLTQSELHDLFFHILSDFYGLSSEEENPDLFTIVKEKAEYYIRRLSCITPISGEIYSFKQGAAIGENIIIDSAYDLKYTERRFSLKNLKSFLDNYNGVKLYRGSYRIGFLGNKESDWIKLQQFRTKGQQWYRFDLGNTLGCVSLSDASQKNIQEISSRLDISENDTSEAFKLLINIVFNYLFYDLNRKANDLIKNLLAEEGLLGEPIAKRVKKNDAALKEMMRRNKRMEEALDAVTKHWSLGERIAGTDHVSLPQKSYDFVETTLKELSDDVQANTDAQKDTAAVLAEVDAQLKTIEVESYNNYKLMANGLITEAITHELHSLSKTGTVPDAEIHFESLKDYFVLEHHVKEYNQHVVPIKNSYGTIEKKLGEIGNLYSFLETTFIRRGTYDDFIQQRILDVIADISKNLNDKIAPQDISIDCVDEDLTWVVPKGVLLHVFYNLINNSLYWIDIRRKRAQSDPFYSFEGTDFIRIEEYGIDGIIVSDSGTGVSQNMEDILFDPLQSGKPFCEGRGMGLYIVKKLLNSFGGNIELMDERNKYGNRYKFLIVRSMSEEL